MQLLVISSKVAAMEVLKQQYTSCMKVGTGRNLDLSREYHKKLFGPLFHSWWNCPLRVTIEIVFWVFDTFHYNLEIKNQLTKYLKERRW